MRSNLEIPRAEFPSSGARPTREPRSAARQYAIGLLNTNGYLCDINKRGVLSSNPESVFSYRRSRLLLFVFSFNPVAFGTNKRRLCARHRPRGLAFRILRPHDRFLITGQSGLADDQYF